MVVHTYCYSGLRTQTNKSLNLRKKCSSMVPLSPSSLKKDLVNKNTKAVSVLMITKNEKMNPLLKISVFPHPSLFGEPAIFLKINQLPPYPNVWKFHLPFPYSAIEDGKELWECFGNHLIHFLIFWFWNSFIIYFNQGILLSL